VCAAHVPHARWCGNACLLAQKSRSCAQDDARCALGSPYYFRPPVPLLSSDRTMASLSCRCGSVKLTFATTQPIWAFECCCVDCYDKNLWSCRAGGVPPPRGLEAHGEGKPLDLRYWPNRLQVTHGKDKLAFNRLREGAASVNMIAACCQTLMCVDHPFYEENVVLTFPEFCPPAGLDPAALPPPTMRVYVKDWPADQYSKLSPKAGFWREQGQPRTEGEGAAEIRSQAARVFTTPPAEVYCGETFQQLLQGAGGRVTSLALPEGQNSFGARAMAARRRGRLAAIGMAVAATGLAVGVAASFRKK
jgi:hypothetical protein